MSAGKKLLRIPANVEVCVTPFQNPKTPFVAAISGPLGTLQFPLFPFVKLDITGSKLTVSVQDKSVAFQRSMWGTTRRIIERQVVGVSEGYTLPIRLSGVGYRAAINDNLVLKLGFSHDVVLPIPEGVKILVPVAQRIILTGIDWEKITQFAAKIRSYRPPEPYNLKGIFVGSETIKKKEGKKR